MTAASRLACRYEVSHMGQPQGPTSVSFLRLGKRYAGFLSFSPFLSLETSSIAANRSVAYASCTGRDNNEIIKVIKKIKVKLLYLLIYSLNLIFINVTAVRLNTALAGT